MVESRRAEQAQTSSRHSSHKTLRTRLYHRTRQARLAAAAQWQQCETPPHCTGQSRFFREKTTSVILTSHYNRAQSAGERATLSAYLTPSADIAATWASNVLAITRAPQTLLHRQARRDRRSATRRGGYTHLHTDTTHAIRTYLLERDFATNGRCEVIAPQGLRSSRHQ